MEYPTIEQMIFNSRDTIVWDDVKLYLKQYQGSSYVVKEYGDLIHINYTTVDEYTGSKYTRRLRGAVVKAKANLVQILPNLIESCCNRRWIKNMSDKHNNNASKGWYRYDAGFELPVIHNGEKDWNRYRCILLVMINDRGLYLYDVLNIRKEASNLR